MSSVLEKIYMADFVLFSVQEEDFSAEVTLPNRLSSSPFFRRGVFDPFFRVGRHGLGLTRRRGARWVPV